MVVLAVSICTKGGKAIVSRHFHPMSRMRIESLLASFPKLIPTNSQHTSVETSDVRYVYQPLEELYILLITNKASNILQDIDTLHLLTRVVSDMCKKATQREISNNVFNLANAFDEIISLGYREQVNLMQVRSVLEMESHEEKIQEIIARNKEAEAKEELKRRAKQLEMQRREQQKRAVNGGSNSYLGGGVSGYSPISQRFDAVESVAARTSSPAPSSSNTRAPAFKGSGMKLGSKKTKQAELLDALGGEVLSAEEQSIPSTPIHEEVAPAKDSRGSLPVVATESIHVAIKEQISLSLAREGGLKSMELTGDMNLTIADASLARIKLALASSSSDFGNDIVFRQHPQVAKFTPGQAKVVALKDSARSFPTGQANAVLKWRYSGTDESYVPLSINCWPSPSNDGNCEVNIEYDLENQNVTLHDVLISIPLPSGSYPTVSAAENWSLNPSTHSLEWSIPLISHEERSGSLEFTVGGDDVGAFFPVRVSFVGQGSIAGVSVSAITRVDNGEAAVFSSDAIVTAGDYLVL